MSYTLSRKRYARSYHKTALTSNEAEFLAKWFHLYRENTTQAENGIVFATPAVDDNDTLLQTCEFCCSEYK